MLRGLELRQEQGIRRELRHFYALGESARDRGNGFVAHSAPSVEACSTASPSPVEVACYVQRLRPDDFSGSHDFYCDASFVPQGTRKPILPGSGISAKN